MMICQPAVQIEQRLEERYGETPVFAAELSGERGYMVLFFNIDSGTWHIVIEPRPMDPAEVPQMCIRASGSKGDLYWPTHPGNPA